MGAAEQDRYALDCERPARWVEVRPFAMSAVPVTLGNYREWKPDHDPGSPDSWPVAEVSWFEAVEYCQRHDARLPSEEEWEYAARAGSVEPWGSSLTSPCGNYFYSEQGERIGLGSRTPVQSFAANPFGLFDMLGNVCEWTSSGWQASYAVEPEAGPAAKRVIRGGAWDYLPRLLRVSWRDGFPPYMKRDNIGFRMARDV